MSELDRLVEIRETRRAEVERMLLAVKAAGRTEVNAAELRICNDLRELDSKIAHLRSEEERGGGATLQALSDRVNTNTRKTSMNNTPRPGFDYHLTYRQFDRGGPGGSSWVRDLMRVSIAGMDDTGESRQRLQRHAQEVAQDPAYIEFRDLSRTDGQGGYAVPPAWLMNQYIELARPGRAFANLVQRQPLPGGTDSINIPKILTGTSVGVQTGDNVTVTEVDLSDTFINAPVRTISGQQGVAIQLIDQSPIAFDDVIFRDLVAAHAAVVDTQVIDGTGTNGQVLGVDYTPNIQTVTAGAVTIAGVYSAIADAIQRIHTKRFLPPEVIVMHPRRWGWFQSLLDSQNRPLFLPTANGLWNVAGVLEDVASQQVVGQMFGLPVVTDPNISIISGSEYASYGNEDCIYVLRASDLVLWESGIRARVLPETRANQLTVLLQIYSFLAFAASRYPQSIAVITGLTEPSFTV